MRARWTSQKAQSGDEGGQLMERACCGLQASPLFCLYAKQKRGMREECANPQYAFIQGLPRRQISNLRAAAAHPHEASPTQS